MQRRFSCTTSGGEPCISSTTSSSSIGPTNNGAQQQQQRTPLARSITPTALPTTTGTNVAMRARSLRRTSAQESVDSAFQLLAGGNRRKGSADAYVGQLQPDLYRRRGSVISVGSSGGGAQVLGRVQLQLSYDHSTSDVVIRLAQMNLQTPPAPLNQCQKLRLLCTPMCSNGSISSNNSNMTNANSCNGEAGAAGGRVVAARARETAALSFDTASGQCNNLPKEPLKLPLDYVELAQAVLHVELLAQTSETPVAVADACAASAEGQARRAACSVPLCPLGPSADDLTVWADLERTEETHIRGELLLCLQYLPAAERLTLSVHQASNLRLSASGCGSARGNGLPSDVFVRAQLIGPDEKVLKRRKSGARKRTLEPVWDEVLSFEADAATLPRCRLEVQLIGSDRFGRGERLIGQVHFGTSAAGTAATAPARMTAAARLWRDAIERQWSVPRWVVLESPMDSAGAAGGGAILE